MERILTIFESQMSNNNADIPDYEYDIDDGNEEVKQGAPANRYDSISEASKYPIFAWRI
jgi:hypothetical protein